MVGSLRRSGTEPKEKSDELEPRQQQDRSQEIGAMGSAVSNRQAVLSAGTETPFPPSGIVQETRQPSGDSKRGCRRSGRGDHD
ncbi:MAG: hypothetical protein B7Z55_01265 [Planctomycetales bacterium 12-60-4]|nr:MAG: hypothetical protein B7Z55_01265 [Planctomycetales bacterium 12-60-4]